MSFRFRALSTLACASLIVIGCGNKPQTQQKSISSMFDKEGTLTFLNEEGNPITTIDIEIADDPQSRETGMMGRPMLGENHGMLFVFQQEQHLSFWMMNTMISLDMIFADANGTIVTIHRNAVPFSQEGYAADKNGLYVLEVNGGFCDRYGIGEGDTIEWERIGE
jgi:uncharacterized membrane protein (UPF0127 family)